MFKGVINKSQDQDIITMMSGQYQEKNLAQENLERMKPLLKAVYQMCQTEGWKKYIKPFLERHGNPAQLFECLRNPEKRFEVEAPRIEAFAQILNYINSLEKTYVTMLNSEHNEDESDE